MNKTYRSNIIHYVLPAVLTNACSFLFSVVDGLFVGNGAGSAEKILMVQTRYLSMPYPFLLSLESY